MCNLCKTYRNTWCFKLCWYLTLYLTRTRFSVVVQGVARQAEAVVRAWRALTEMLTAVL